MGQKVRPTGFRTGIMMDWLSHWYASKQDFSELLVEDYKIRKFIKKKYPRAGISRDPDRADAREGGRAHLLGPGRRDHRQEGRRGRQADQGTGRPDPPPHRGQDDRSQPPEIDPQLVAEDIAEQLEKRASFRRTMKRAMDRRWRRGQGRQDPAVRPARRLGNGPLRDGMPGSIPLSTLRAKVEYGFAEAKTAQGHIGIKVWINNGDYLNEEEPQDLPPPRRAVAASRAERPD